MKIVAVAKKYAMKRITHHNYQNRMKDPDATFCVNLLKIMHVWGDDRGKKESNNPAERKKKPAFKQTNKQRNRAKTTPLCLFISLFSIAILYASATTVGYSQVWLNETERLKKLRPKICGWQQTKILILSRNAEKNALQNSFHAMRYFDWIIHVVTKRANYFYGWHWI